jgi:hypothetical protein
MASITSALNAASLQTSFYSSAYSPIKAAILTKPSPILAPSPSPVPKPAAVIVPTAAAAVGFTKDRADAEAGISPVVLAAAGAVALGVIGLVVYKMKKKKR